MAAYNTRQKRLLYIDILYLIEGDVRVYEKCMSEDIINNYKSINGDTHIAS